MDPAAKLRKMGFHVHQFTEYHFRVNDEFDYYLPRGKWHDLLTGERGRKPLDQIPFFVKQRLSERRMHPADRDTFIEGLKQIG